MSKCKQILKMLGENIHNARIRRNITMEILAQRSSISVPTLRSLENGGNVNLNILARVLIELGLEKDLLRVGYNDSEGRSLQDQNLKQRARQNDN